MEQNGKEVILQRNVKIAGWAYFLIILSSILSMIFISSKYTVMGDNQATLLKMVENEMFFRINSVYEIIMFSAVILLAVMLYEILKSVNKGLARTAMLLRTGEAIVGFVTVLCSIMALIILKEKAFVSGLAPEQVNSLAITFLAAKDTAYTLLMSFISLGTIIYCYLFLKSKFIPAFLPVWGIGGFSLMFIASILKVLDLAFAGTVNMIAAVIVITFEFTIGLWLIIKKIQISK